MKVFVFDLLNYGANLDHHKAGHPQLPFPMAKRFFDPAVAVKTYAEHLDAWEEMDRLGYDGVAFNEHHVTPYGLMNSPNLLAASAAQRTKRMKLLMYGNLLPLHQPLRLAEEIAMLDCLSNGRIICGIARGAPREHRVYNIPLEESRARFEEAYTIMRKAWSEEYFTHEGRFDTYRDVSIWPRPVQDPMPVWMPSGSKESLEFAALNDIPITPGLGGPGTEDAIGHYCAVRARAGRETTPDKFIILVEVYIADSKEQAIREYAPHLMYLWNTLFNFDHVPLRSATGFYGAESAGHLRPELRETARDDSFRHRHMTMDDVMKTAETAAWGRPEDVAANIIQQADRCGAGTVLLSLNRGAMPQELFLNQIRRFANEVMPIVHAHQVTRVPLAEKVAA